ncbi:MAG: hypothetical protein IPK32_05220 [Verrucomicrobiaceae bacterium]|nr:hypothetical protein [Verrucomicrobiaceae bacterium]
MPSPQQDYQESSSFAPANSPSNCLASLGAEKEWVWHSTVSSQKEGAVSVLACVETFFAVCLYWWIAIRFDTHWHLLSSAAVAPMLLLRSPKSIALGAHWFSSAPFIRLSVDKSHLTSNRIWIGFIFLIFFGLGLAFTKLVTVTWLSNLEGLQSILGYFVAGLVLILVAHVIVIAVWGLQIALDSIPIVLHVPLIGTIVGSILPAFLWGGNIAGITVIVSSIIGSLAVIAAEYLQQGGSLNKSRPLLSWTLMAFNAIGLALGFTLRALILRVISTAVTLHHGIKYLPNNWRENQFLIDSTHPAELIPGVRSLGLPFNEFTSDGLLFMVKNAKFDKEGKAELFTLVPLLGVCFFLPAFLYRLNIKATAWFWWPLAYLLKPAQLTEVESQQKQSLCWPWTNPFQRLLIVFSVLLVLASLILHYSNAASWSQLQSIPALTVALRILLAIDWSHITPWHWAQWAIAGSGLGMLFLAGNARSHDVNGNWKEFSINYPTQIRVMTGLLRLRTIATIALLLMGFGALLIHDSSWQSYHPLPPTWIDAIKDFYQFP